MADEIYIHRELLGYSKEKRYVELITITGKNDKTNEREEVIEGEGLFPKIEPSTRADSLFSKKRAFIFEKPTVFLSARVHPGEVQSSHVLNGIVDFLMSKTQ